MLPHIQNSLAGRNRLDPVFKSIFEVEFDLPQALIAQFNGDRNLLTEHVLSVDGLDALDRAPETGEQKFMGTTRSYIKPMVESTSADLTIKFTLNLRDGVDNYIYKILRAWSRLGYNIETGERTMKKDYCADWFKIRIANQEGTVYREIVFKDMMMAGPLSGASGNLDYSENEAMEVEAKFRSDWWSDVLA